ncbi:alanine--tRNA ligase [Brachybacterium saurashtrense]|uniref:Alanine--tRNA ligase n=1 Tax=Brachybacterium saurashtrense TaxID=556288 RepID=A0A345YMK4_9MICO|nr:alanine--tRNA ligase [Brachybacterium saurashtrense]AXK45156.1 alanine--tRNA ligase [Brachybacterium saurashtrense]RRR22090.1 alanine--tRNA ligase [Brachybacterium saurashtrense]
MRTSEIHRRFLAHFEKKAHEVVPSASLVSNDPSILFTIAGMVPFIPYIVGSEKAPYDRAVSVQKCIRTNDIENVGRTTRHGTFFQMAGNFSFGDYFKAGAIDFSWELLTSSVDEGGYGLDPERLWITLWEEDQESYDHLTEVIGLDPSRIVRLPWEESCWDTGQPGPAGSTGEWYYDRGPEYGPDAPTGTLPQWPGDERAEDRYLEIWNLVFDQFLRGPGKGKDYQLLGELDQKAIDTGLGVERLAYLLQGKQNMYEIDQIFPVIEKAQELSGRRYGADEEDDVRLRIVGDHVRSALMLVGDGVRPGNEGRGYVLRRLIRRAVRSMRLLGHTDPSMPHLLPISLRLMAESYPELEAHAERITEVVCAEEDAFRRTLETGTALFDQVARSATEGGGRVLPGDEAFKLHDTYGFPIDLTMEMAAEVGLQVDADAFRAAMQEQRERARADAAAKKTGHTDTAVYNRLLTERGGEVPFLGYTEDTVATTVESVLVDGALVNAVQAPAQVEVVLASTPFYAESGGQLADQGSIALTGGGLVEVDDVQKPVRGLIVHRGRLVEGELAQGVSAIASIDRDRRGAIARAHTATHMVHESLREELGDSATQAGSENSPGRMRFDFRYGQAVPKTVLEQVEGRVNTLLQEELTVTDQQMPIDEARALGAQALFGEKYGDIVRVVSIGGDWSRELCGGTHVATTGALGTVQLMGEASIGSGVRRVDALVGLSAYRHQATSHALVSQLSEMLKVGGPEELPERVRSLTQRLKDMEKQVAALRGQQLQAQAGALVETAADVAGVRLLAHDAGEGIAAGDLRTLALDLRTRLGEDAPVVVAVAGHEDGRAALVIATNAAARERGHAAGAILKGAAAAMGGRGGGKPDLAQGGGGTPAEIPAALGAVREALAGTPTA